MGWKTEAKNFEIADYLLIKLANVIVGLPLGLNVDRMILDTFSCGHDWLLPRERGKKRASSDCARNKDTWRETNRTRVSRWGRVWRKGG